MRKKYLLAAAAIIGGAGIFLALKRTGPAALHVTPEVLNVRTSQVTIAWLSEESYKGRIFYKQAGSDASPLSASESFGASDRHEVMVTGLSPSTRYAYWIENSEGRFQFQTQPLLSTPFSFMFVWGDMSRRILPLMMAESPQFVVSLTDLAKKGADWFSDVRPYVPVYGPSGVDSVFLRSIESEHPADSPGLWNLDWGGLRLVFLDKTGDIRTMLDAPAAHTLGIITSAEVVQAFKAKAGIDVNNITRPDLHSTLLAHNKQNPTRPVAFVGVMGGNDEAIQVGGVQYFGILAKRGGNGAIRVDVDVESVTAFFIDENRQIALRKPPLVQKRTCEECRRLADKGAYEQSVRAYKEFIETHEGHFQIDDAYFAIAEILDEKLFRFQEALPWYHRLIIEYPDGTLTPLAKQRIRYLSEYSEYDYRPLARFEQIRKVEFARRKDISQQRDKLLEEVASVISEYPDANLAPVMQYWLANQYRQTGPQKAVDAYYVLREKYPDHPDAREVLMDIGQTCYEAGRYEEAMEVYGKALLELPSLEGVIKVQISRCKRNIRRDWFALVCWPLLVLISAVAILTTPVGIGMSKIASSLAVFALLAAFLSFGAWLIYEQFSSVREMLLIVISFAAAAGVSSLISVSLAEKLFGKRLNSIQAGPGVLSVVAGSIVGLILFTAGLYLAIYYINAHYLIVVGM